MNTTNAPRTVDSLSAIEAMGAVEQFLSQNQGELAANLYRLWLSSHPQDPAAYAIAFNLGVILKDVGEEGEAELAYRRAIELNPSCLEAYFNLGSQLERLNRPREALAQWQSMIDSERFSLPRDGKLYQLTLNNLGRLHENLREYDVAERMLIRSLEQNPDQKDVLHHLIYLRQKQCKWPVYPDLPGVALEKMVVATGPLSLLAASDDPEQHLLCGRRYAEEKIPVPEQALTNGERYSHAKLRVGYLSSDYCLHPVSMLTAELFELHDRSRFEIFGFCWSRDDGSTLRQRVVQAFDHYIQIGGMTDEQAARHIRSLEIDILVDLHGLTLGSRPGILAWRPAPVQITYLGFPGINAIPGVDYVLADRFVVPKEETAYFPEKPLYLSKCFQVSDRKREVGPKPTRESCGLPEQAFVYCSFNNNYKFTPEVFSVWMRILHQVPNSVLWLLADNHWAEENLRREAETRGVSRERLIFASRVSPADYLARYQLADLFLDTRPFGAGTTANDALWMGVPFLTCPGRTFASRMAGSLLTTLGLTELIASDLHDYEEKAVAIGKDPERNALLHSYLASRVKHSPLFDMPATVREIEDIYHQALAGDTAAISSTAAPHALPASATREPTPFFTIVVVHYEGSVSHQETVRCLQSLYFQKYRNFEIIFLHDGPRSRPWETVDFPPPDDIAVRIVETETRANDYGHTLRDLGIKMAAGEYVLITNADNYHYTNMLQEIYQEAKRSYSPMVIHGVDRKAPDIIVFGILASGYISLGSLDEIVDLRKHDKLLASNQWQYLSGYPTVFRNVDCMQFVMRRELWLKEGGWYFKAAPAADGIIYQDLAKKYGVRYVVGPLAEHL